MNEYSKRNKNNEPKVDDTYKRCLTRAVGNTLEESKDGELKLENYNLAMEMHKKTKKRIQKRLKQSELMRRNLTEN